MAKCPTVYAEMPASSPFCAVAGAYVARQHPGRFSLMPPLWFSSIWARPAPQYATHVPLSGLEKGALALLSLWGAFRDPRRGDLVAASGEMTGLPAIQAMRGRMRRSETGRLILQERPLITVGLEAGGHAAGGLAAAGAAALVWVSTPGAPPWSLAALHHSLTHALPPAPPSRTGWWPPAGTCPRPPLAARTRVSWAAAGSLPRGARPAGVLVGSCRAWVYCWDERQLQPPHLRFPLCVSSPSGSPQHAAAFGRLVACLAALPAAHWG
jgi:hypothetical protein